MGPFERFFSRLVPQLLGKVSFSVYLLHVPVLVTFAYLFGPSTWIWPVVLTLILIVPVAYLFMRFVEAPATKLGRKVGVLVSKRYPQLGFIERPIRSLLLQPVSSARDVM